MHLFRLLTVVAALYVDGEFFSMRIRYLEQPTKCIHLFTYV
jgi:hypothetical protein